MKNKLTTLFLLPAFMLLLLWSCKKEENKVFYEGGTSPVLTATRTGTIPLSFATKDQQAIALSWTNPEYHFTTGISSQDVSYLLEIDTTNSNFTSPKRQTFSLARDLTKSFTVGEFNDFLLNQLQLDTLIPHNVEMRITSSIHGSVPLYSNVLKFTGVKPYAIPPKVVPPSTGTLFIVGSATQGGSTHGWDNPISQSVPAQQFTKLSNTLYTITLPLIGAGEYKFIAVNGSWNDQWSIATADDPNEINGGDFVFNGANILAPPVSGNYKIDVDFQRGKFTVTKL